MPTGNINQRTKHIVHHSANQPTDSVTVHPSFFKKRIKYVQLFSVEDEHFLGFFEVTISSHAPKNKLQVSKCYEFGNQVFVDASYPDLSAKMHFIKISSSSDFPCSEKYLQKYLSVFLLNKILFNGQKIKIPIKGKLHVFSVSFDGNIFRFNSSVQLFLESNSSEKYKVSLQYQFLGFEKEKDYILSEIQNGRHKFLLAGSETGKINFVVDIAKFLNISFHIILGLFSVSSPKEFSNLISKKSPSKNILILANFEEIAPNRTNSEFSGISLPYLEILLTQLQNIHQNLLVFALVGDPNTLDPAVQRAGRFDLTLNINNRTAVERIEIFTSFFSFNFTAEQKNLIQKTISQFNSEQIKLLAKETKLLFNSSNLFESCLEISYKKLKSQFSSSSLLSAPKIPKVKWDDIAGNEEAKRILFETVVLPLSHPNIFIQMNLSFPKGVLLYGPPGCSKTLLAKAVASESQMAFLAVKGPELLASYLGESERNVKKLYQNARKVGPSVVFFDEIDAVSGSSRVMRGVISQLLQELDGIGDSDTKESENLNEMKRDLKSSRHVVTIAATNRPDLLDKALIRPGRFDRLVYIGAPDFAARKKILEIHTENLGISDILLEEVAQKVDGFSGAEIVAAVREAKMKTLLQDKNASKINEDCLREGAEIIRNQGLTIDAEMTEFYEKFKQNIKS
eukprot:snap_masked-scaffold_3-processed-gene-8.24-mRNA-1 protein AED:0.30 eAED:0.30 QI:0/0/0/1/1/1/2/0/680